MPRLFLFFVVITGISADLARAAPAERRATIFYTGGIQGTLEPCGCTSDPLGDVARMTGVIRRARKEGPVLLVDAGNLTYPATEVPAHRQEAAHPKAGLPAAQPPQPPLPRAAPGGGDPSPGAQRGE